MKEKNTEQSQEINELGFDTPAIVDQKIIELITSLIESPQFVKDVLEHAGMETTEEGDELYTGVAQIVGERLNRILRAVEETPNRFPSSETDKYDELPDSPNNNLQPPKFSMNEEVQNENKKTIELMRKIK